MKLKKIDIGTLKHIAFIMDGNRRWATAKGMAASFGHSAGYRSMMAVIRRCVELGIEYVSFFAWSTENWKRSEEEISKILDIAREKAGEDIEKLMQMGIRFTTMGDTKKFPKDLQEKLEHIIQKTKNNTRCVLNLCINYGGRDDIVSAVNKVIASSQKTHITEKEFEKHLYGTDLPDIDLVVRTSGEQRISNFMLWKLAYSEIYFTKKFWPMVNEKFVDECVIQYNKRTRKFGGNT